MCCVLLLARCQDLCLVLSSVAGRSTVSLSLSQEPPARTAPPSGGLVLPNDSRAVPTERVSDQEKEKEKKQHSGPTVQVELSHDVPSLPRRASTDTNSEQTPPGSASGISGTVTSEQRETGDKATTPAETSAQEAQSAAEQGTAKETDQTAATVTTEHLAEKLKVAKV